MSKNAPTVIGLILTPSSRCAFVASSASLPWSTFLPQRVFTNVVRPYWTSHQLLLLPRRSCKGEYTSSRSTTDHKAELDTLLDILLPTNLDLQHPWVSTRMRVHNVDVNVQPWHGTTTQRWVRRCKRGCAFTRNKTCLLHSMETT